ncbi:MAG: YitT family protein [Oscillospiraceae bacterium]
MNRIKGAFTRKNLLYALLLNLGLILTALGIHFFKGPNHFAIGGTSGLSILAAALVPNIDIGGFMFIVNAALIVLGLAFLGKEFTGITFYSSMALSFFVWILEKIYPMTKPFTQDTLLELCFAVLLPAVGSALVFNIGASTGGTDIIAMILSRRTSLEIGKALLVSDAFITVGALMMFGVRTGLYCVLGLLAKAFVVDGAIEGINVRKQITIISEHTDEILDYIMHMLKRGATVYDARGAYTHNQEHVITTVLGRKETVQLRNFIHTIDKNAFLTIVNSSETIGKGFRNS